MRCLEMKSSGSQQNTALISRVNALIALLEKYDRHSNMNAEEIINRIPADTINFYYVKVVLNK